jgi:hypothetical protein
LDCESDPKRRLSEDEFTKLQQLKDLAIDICDDLTEDPTKDEWRNDARKLFELVEEIDGIRKIRGSHRDDWKKSLAYLREMHRTRALSDNSFQALDGQDNPPSYEMATQLNQ